MLAILIVVFNFFDVCVHFTGIATVHVFIHSGYQRHIMLIGNSKNLSKNYEPPLPPRS